MQRMLLRRLIAALAVVLSGLAITLVGPQVASAHHPEIEVSTECTTGGWTATYTISPDEVRGYNWNIEGGGIDSAIADQVNFTRIHTLGFDDVSDSYSSGTTRWWDTSGNETGTHAGESATAIRPDGCEAPDTTTTTTSTTTTTTTSSPTTTTVPPCEFDSELPADSDDCYEPCEFDSELPADSDDCYEPCEFDSELPADSDDCYEPCEFDPELPADSPDCTPPPVCEYDPELPGDSPDCVADVTISALCREYHLAGQSRTAIGYWYDVSNGEDVPVVLTYAGSTLVLDAGETARIRVDSTSPQFLVRGTAIDTPTPSDDCEMQVEVIKELDGPPPGEALYTVDIAYYDDGTETLILTFELSSEEPEVITLPASYSSPDGEGAVEYIVRETGANQGTIVSYSPSNRFFGSGNVGEQVSVVITNSYAAVEIEKTVNDDFVEPGQIIFYEMIVSNTGGLPLENLSIDDLFPATIFYVDYEIVGDSLPISCHAVPTPDGPDFLSCDATGVLEPGETLPVIRVTAEVGPDAANVDHFDNQSRVIGDFVVDEDGPAPAGFQRGAFGQSRGIHVELSPARLAAAPPPPGENLSCAPVEGQVCNVSPVVLAVGQVPDGPTTTTVASGLPTTTIVSGGLPETGSDSVGVIVVLAGTLLLAGSAALVITRRRAIG